MLLNNFITSTYKKSNNNIKKIISISGRNFLKDKEVLQRIDIDNHKEKSQRKLQNNPSVRLVNPAKMNTEG